MGHPVFYCLEQEEATSNETPPLQTMPQQQATRRRRSPPAPRQSSTASSGGGDLPTKPTDEPNDSVATETGMTNIDLADRSSHKMEIETRG